MYVSIKGIIKQIIISIRAHKGLTISLQTNLTKGDESHCTNSFIRERKIVTKWSFMWAQWEIVSYHTISYIHTYIHTYVHTHIHAYMHIYIHMCICIYKKGILKQIIISIRAQKGVTISLQTNLTKGDESYCSNCFICEREIVTNINLIAQGEIVSYHTIPYIHTYIHTHIQHTYTYTTYIHIYIHIYNIHTYIHIYNIHIYICT